MRLLRMRVEAYRSIKEPLEVQIDPRVTVFLGANDHGKSNLLHAIRHLNGDVPFVDDDLNWDSRDTDSLPRIDYYVYLSEDDRHELLEISNKLIEKTSDDEDEDDEEDATEPADEEDATEPADDNADNASSLDLLAIGAIPNELHVWRSGLKGERKIETPSGLPNGAATALIEARLPRVELIEPFGRIPDEVTAAQLPKAEFEFMQGIFLYAGLDRNEWPSVFSLNDTTRRRLAQASNTLDETLRRTWTQGRDLGFELAHDSARDAITLRLSDPAVTDRVVRASQRSSGFTHFFSLRTVLHAREEAQPAASHIWLFDEPGVYLHPAGQHDLLQALEAVAEHNQIVYSTHSVFLVNKNYPVRHRLIVKRAAGTALDSKPYATGWHAALEALGLSLPGTILFARYVLLTEGDSEPILLYTLLRRILQAGRADVDLNPLAIVSTGNARNADVIIRILSEASIKPKIAVLLDGDRGGSDRLAHLKATLVNKGIPFRQLTKETTVEDHMPFLKESFAPALSAYVAALRKDAGKAEDPDLRDKAERSYKTSFGAPLTAGVARWAREQGRLLGDLENDPSAVGIAREYAEALDARPVSDFVKLPKRTADLVVWITSTLGLPSPVAPVEAVEEA